MLPDKLPVRAMVYIKYALLLFNLIYIVTGICLVFVGWSINYMYIEYSGFLEPEFFSPDALMIVIGFVIFAIASFGGWGAYKENPCMITTFGLSLSLVFSLEVAAGMTALLLQSEIHQLVVHTISQSISNSPYSNSSARMMDVLQSEMQCCGLDSFKDWEGVYQETNLVLPESCCALYEDSICTRVFQAGCLAQLESFLSESMVLMVITAFTLAIVQLTGVWLSWSLARMIRIFKSDTYCKGQNVFAPEQQKPLSLQL